METRGTPSGLSLPIFPLPPPRIKNRDISSSGCIGRSEAYNCVEARDPNMAILFSEKGGGEDLPILVITRTSGGEFPFSRWKKKRKVVCRINLVVRVNLRVSFSKTVRGVFPFACRCGKMVWTCFSFLLKNVFKSPQIPQLSPLFSHSVLASLLILIFIFFQHPNTLKKSLIIYIA